MGKLTWKIGTEKWVVLVTIPDHVVWEPLELICGESLEWIADVGWRNLRMQ